MPATLSTCATVLVFSRLSWLGLCCGNGGTRRWTMSASGTQFPATLTLHSNRRHAQSTWLRDAVDVTHNSSCRWESVSVLCRALLGDAVDVALQAVVLAVGTGRRRDDCGLRFQLGCWLLLRLLRQVKLSYCFCSSSSNRVQQSDRVDCGLPLAGPQKEVLAVRTLECTSYDS